LKDFVDELLVCGIGFLIGGMAIFFYLKDNYTKKLNTEISSIKKEYKIIIKDRDKQYKKIINKKNRKYQELFYTCNSTEDSNKYNYTNNSINNIHNEDTLIYSSYDQFKRYLNEDKFFNALDIYEKKLADNKKENYSSLLKKYIFEKYEKNISLGRYYAKKALEIEPDHYYYQYISMISDANTQSYKSAILKTIELKNKYIPTGNISESVDKYYNSTTRSYYNKIIKFKDRNILLSAMEFFEEIQKYDYSQKIKNKK